MMPSASLRSSQKKEIEPGDLVVNQKYTILNCLYEGPKSQIFTIAFMKSGKQVTRIIKIQNQAPPATSSKKSGQEGIKQEITVFKNIFISDYGKVEIMTGFPHIYEFGAESFYNYVVMKLYGPNLAQMMKLCGGKFSLRTSLLIGLQILDRLEELHDCKFLYRNIRPQNFLIGLGKESFLIYMIDFSRCLKYKSKSKGTHIPYQQFSLSNDPAGTQALKADENAFTSVNHQIGIQSSRRDDIESLMFMILYMVKGKLPWYALNNNDTSNNLSGVLNNEEKVDTSPNINIGTADRNGGKVVKQVNGSLAYVPGSSHNLESNQRDQFLLELKRKISVQSLFKNMSLEIMDAMNYIRTVSFYEKPDYAYLKKKLWNALLETDYEQLRNNILVYDWNLREKLDYDIYREVPKFKLREQDDEEDGNGDEEPYGESFRKSKVKLQQPRIRQRTFIAINLVEEKKKQVISNGNTIADDANVNEDELDEMPGKSLRDLKKDGGKIGILVSNDKIGSSMKKFKEYNEAVKANNDQFV